MAQYYDDYNLDTDSFSGEFVYGDNIYVDEYYMDERWKTIRYFPRYWISTHGRIYGPGRGGRGQFLKPVLQNGYLKVTLTHSGTHVDKRVNRLVADAFIPNPYDLPVVMHLDNDPLNNHVSNLAWGTYSENNQYIWDCGRHPGTLTDEIRERAYAARRTPVVAIDMCTGERQIFASQHDAARALGVMQQHVWGVLKGTRRSTGGYRFEYLDTGGRLR